MRDCWFSWGGDGLLQLIPPPLRPGDGRVPQVSHAAFMHFEFEQREQNQVRKYCIEAHPGTPLPGYQLVYYWSPWENTDLCYMLLQW